MWPDRNAAHFALGFGGSSIGFPVVLSPTPIAHVSASLPMIPDGRISGSVQIHAVGEIRFKQIKLSE